MHGEQPGGHVHVRVRMHQQQRAAHRHVRGRVHVRQLLRAQPDRGAGGHVAGLVGTGRAVHAAGRRRRVATAAAAARPAPVPAVPGDDDAADGGGGDHGRGRRGRIVRGQKIPLPSGCGGGNASADRASRRLAAAARPPRAVHQFHIEQPTELHVQAGRAAVHDDDHDDDGRDDDGGRQTAGRRQREQGGLGVVAQVGSIFFKIYINRTNASI